MELEDFRELIAGIIGEQAMLDKEHGIAEVSHSRVSADDIHIVMADGTEWDIEITQYEE